MTHFRDERADDGDGGEESTVGAGGCSGEDTIGDHSTPRQARETFMRASTTPAGLINDAWV
jgi:hypothetical protein